MSQDGVENISVFEKILSTANSTYLLSIIVGGLILGPIGAVIISYIFTTDITAAIENATVLYFTETMNYWKNVLGLFFLQLIMFYLLFMIKYMYGKLDHIKYKLIELLPGGDAEFKDIFSIVTKPAPPLIMAGVFMVLYGVQAIPEENFLAFGINRFSIVFLFSSYAFWFVAFTAFFWVYASSIRGLYVMGKRQLNLRTYAEDKMLGVKPISSLSLSFAFTYFTGLGLLILLPIALSESAPSFSYYFVVVVVTLLGLIIFFLPLYSFHLQMRTHKEAEKGKLRRMLLDASNIEEISDSPESIVEVKRSIDRLSKIIQTEIIQEDIEKIPVWPINLSILGRLAAMAVSIITIILANYIMKRIIHL